MKIKEKSFYILSKKKDGISVERKSGYTFTLDGVNYNCYENNGITYIIDRKTGTAIFKIDMAMEELDNFSLKTMEQIIDIFSNEEVISKFEAFKSEMKYKKMKDVFELMCKAIKIHEDICET